MMRIVWSFLACLLLHGLVQAQSFSVAETAFIQIYEGALGGKYPVVMRLVSWGNGSLNGDYYYKKVGKRIALFGEIKDINVVELSEYSDGVQTGTFQMQFVNDLIIKGVWTSGDGKRKLPFELKARNQAPDAWAGTWHLNDVWDGGMLLVGNVRKDSLDFALLVFRSGHIGEIWGSAKRQGNRAIFMHVEQDFVLETDDDPEPCHLLFELKNNQIEIQQESSGWVCGFGMRAYASGVFDNKKIDIKPTLSVGTGEEYIFDTQAQHDGFKQLVGAPFYEVFAFNMQGFLKGDGREENGFDCTIVEGAVYGMFSVHEAIIIYDKQGKYWAMTIDYENEEDLVLRYFTNDKRHQRQLPRAIARWMERFGEYPVRYESK
jgi:hypothetical protein